MIFRLIFDLFDLTKLIDSTEETEQRSKLTALDIFSSRDLSKLCSTSRTSHIAHSLASLVIGDGEESTDQQVISESIEFLYDHNAAVVSNNQSSSSAPSKEPHQYQDYRFGRIRIDWMDRKRLMSKQQGKHQRKTDSGDNKNGDGGGVQSLASSTPEYLPFVSGHTELNSGILRLYRNHNRSVDSIVADKLDILAVLAVPAFMSVADYLHFIRPFDNVISHYRIVHDSQPNRYMVLMKFRDSAAAADFYQQINGKTFNPMRPEICNVVYVESVEFKNSSVSEFAFPINGSQERTVIRAAMSTICKPLSYAAAVGEATTTPVGERNPDNNALIELPTCPVCLDRMDSAVTGMITIMCNHTFHCQCLSKWADSTCPVCRYSHRIVATEQPGAVLTDHECFECRTHCNLWICLICGHVGCGRYQDAHAQKHFEQTRHLYAMELETSRVWDYKDDGYVHRLIQNKSDGKLMELSGPSDKEPSKKLSQDKLDALGLEFSYLLTSSLESQRLFYEDQISQVTSQCTLQHHKMLELEQKYSQLRSQHQRLLERCEVEARRLEEFQAVSNRHSVETKQLNDRLRQQQQRIKDLERSWDDEKAVSASLQSTTALWIDKIKEKDRLIAEKQRQIEELQEQVGDLMIFLESREKIERLVEAADSATDRQSIIDGSVELPQPANNAPSRTAKQRKAKKRW